MQSVSTGVDFLNSISETDDLTTIILNVIKEKDPQSVKQLVQMLKEHLDLSEQDIINYVLRLESEGVIRIRNQTLQPLSLTTYLKTSAAIWYWLTIFAESITAILIFAISDSVYPWIYARNFFGLVFVLFLPGYAFVKALFPIRISSETSTDGLESVKRIALSIAMSIALVSILGLILYYSPPSLNLDSVVLSLFALTFVFATVAVFREYNQRKTK